MERQVDNILPVSGGECCGNRMWTENYTTVDVWQIDEKSGKENNFDRYTVRETKEVEEKGEEVVQKKVKEKEEKKTEGCINVLSLYEICEGKIVCGEKYKR